MLATHGNDLNASSTRPVIHSFKTPFPSSSSHLCSNHSICSFLSGSPGGLSVEACQLQEADNDSTLLSRAAERGDFEMVADYGWRVVVGTQTCKGQMD